MRKYPIGHDGQFPAEALVESLHSRQATAQKDREGDVAIRVVATVCDST